MRAAHQKRNEADLLGLPIQSRRNRLDLRGELFMSASVNFGLPSITLRMYRLSVIGFPLEEPRLGRLMGSGISHYRKMGSA